MLKDVSWGKMSKESRCSMMQATREVAFRLAREGYLHVTQRGVVLSNPSHQTVKGPIRLRVVKVTDSELSPETGTEAATPAEAK